MPLAPRHLAALLAVQVCFGGLAVAAKFALLGFPPLVLAAFRVALAGALLLAIERVALRGVPRPRGGDLARLFGLALLGVVLNQALFISGLARTTAVDAVLIVATIPAFTVAIAAALGRERFTAVRGVGLLVAFAGVALLVGLDAIDLGVGNLVGNAMVALNALSYAFYLVLSRPLLAKYDPLTVAAYTFALGAPAIFLLSLPQLGGFDAGSVPAVAWVGFAYVVLFGSVAAYGLNNWALRHVEAGTVASFVYLQPLVTVAAAIPLLGERPTVMDALAGATILLGVAIASRGAPVRRAPAA